MPKKGLTAEQKQKVPRNLRGAGVRRHWCSFCDTWHPYPQNVCEKHPSYASREANRRKASSEAGKRMVENGHFDRMNQKLKILQEDPKWKAEVSRKISKGVKGKVDRRGEKNGMYGRKHSPETRAKMSRSLAPIKGRLTTSDLLKLHAPQMPAPTAFDFFRTQAPPPPERRDEFSGGRFVEDVFGTDEFDPFH